MKLTRYLRPEQVRLELLTRTPPELPEGWTYPRLVREMRERVLDELVGLFEASGRVGNRSKLFTDLLHRELKASTALGEGLAVPHVRTMQAKDFILVLARSTPGVEFGAPDGRPVHIFVGIVAPPYQDRLYLQIYGRIAEVFVGGGKERLMNAQDPHEVIRILSDVQSWGKVGPNREEG